MDVPTNVVPYYSKSAAFLEQGLEVDITLALVSADGDVVAVSVESKYSDDFLTTGEGPFDGTLELPDAFLIHYHFAAPTASSRSPWPSGTCVALTSQYAVVSTVIDEFGRGRRWRWRCRCRCRAPAR